MKPAARGMQKAPMGLALWAHWRRRRNGLERYWIVWGPGHWLLSETMERPAAQGGVEMARPENKPYPEMARLGNKPYPWGLR